MKTATLFVGLAIVATYGCGSSPTPPCSATCGGCCTSAGECVAGAADGACGSTGTSCADCTATSQQCFITGDVRSCISPGTGGGAAGAGGGSSGGGTGGSGSGGGSGGGSACVPTKSCSSAGWICGALYTGCGSVNCGSCVAPLTCMAGIGKCDQSIAVTFRYQYARYGSSGACPGLSTTSTWTPPVCSIIQTMLSTRFQGLRLNYPSCSTSQTGSDTWTIDCTGGCSSQQTKCLNEATQQYDDRIIWQCPTRQYTNADSCYWAPP